MTLGKRLRIETPRNGAVTWYLLPFLLVAFSCWFFGERFGFQQSWHVCVGTPVLWDSRQPLGSTSIYLRVCTLHQKVISAITYTYSEQQGLIGIVFSRGRQPWNGE